MVYFFNTLLSRMLSLGLSLRPIKLIIIIHAYVNQALISVSENRIVSNTYLDVSIFYVPEHLDSDLDSMNIRIRTES